ncbi:hypothetical protein O6H91_07G004400 [Diphasiastrum complanatum]|uniref:Uncharacterized protein n=1 Tax=Diphasiastrum complanatum TaxID=34168 RepID=A0ACC2D1Z8_DIPCM|nr:hypothetical protein O6H91_07G004400 [Diphasiastrum complanatum]
MQRTAFHLDSMSFIKSSLRLLNLIVLREGEGKAFQSHRRGLSTYEALRAAVDDSLNGIQISPRDVAALQERGISRKILCKIFQMDSQVLRFDIAEVTAKLDALEQLGVDGKSIPRLLDRCPAVLKHDYSETFKPLLQQLENFGIGKQLIGRILTYNPRSLLRMNDTGVQIGAARLRDLVKFLLHHGLAISDVERILSRDPLLLVFTSQSKMQQIVEFLNQLGIDDVSISKIIRRYPSILTRNHDKSLRLKVDFLKSLGMDSQRLSKIVVRYPQMMGFSFEHKFKPTVAFLQNAGLKGDALVKVLLRAPQILGRSVDKSLLERLDFFSSLGFDTKSDRFATAMCITASLSLESLEARFNQLVQFGLSKSDVCKILKSQPQIFKQSQEDIQNKVEFLVKHMKHLVTTLPKAPVFLLYSLEQRTKPRNEVMSFLYSTKKLTKMYCWTTTMTMTEQRFNKIFVDAYPEVAAIYKSRKVKELNGLSELADSISVC